MKKIIIISAINFRKGGPLSVLQDILHYADNHLSFGYQVIALVHSKRICPNFSNIHFIEFPKSASSYLYRLYYEYIYFKKLSKKFHPHLWLSLHDMTPNVEAKIRAVYCHNPAPFYNISLRECLLEPTFALFNLFYKYLYFINIYKNQYVIVQQEWLRKKFQSFYGIKNIIVSHPEIKKFKYQQNNNKPDNLCYCFFYPTLPRVFKNIEIICEAVKILNNKLLPPFKVIITIEKIENQYTRYIGSLSKEVKNLDFIGRLSREEVYKFYKQIDCLIFSSKLETWGLPISEFKEFEKPMLVADLEYAHETVGNYKKVNFFNPHDPYELASYMEKAIMQKLTYDIPKNNCIKEPFSETWEELFAIMLNYDCKSRSIGVSK